MTATATDRANILIGGMVELLSALVNFTDKDGNDREVDAAFFNECDEATLTGAIKAAKENLGEFDAMLATHEQNNVEIDKAISEMDERLRKAINHLGVIDETHPPITAEEFPQFMDRVRALVGQTLLLMSAVAKHQEAQMAASADAPEAETPDMPPVRELLGRLVDGIDLISADYGEIPEQYPDGLATEGMTDPELIDCLSVMFIGAIEKMKATVASTESVKNDLWLLISRIATVCNHEGVGLDHSIVEASDSETEAQNIDAARAALQSIEERLVALRENPAVVINQDAAQSALVAMLEENPLALEALPAFANAVAAKVQEHVEQLPTKTGMSAEQVEHVIEGRVAEFKEMAEIKYNEFYVNIDGGTPYIICSKSSGRYLTCDFKDKPKPKDWRRSKDFSDAHWFGSKKACEKLIKKLRENKVKWAKRLEPRKVRLIAPDD